MIKFTHVLRPLSTHGPTSTFNLTLLDSGYSLLVISSDSEPFVLGVLPVFGCQSRACSCLKSEKQVNTAEF